MIVMKCGLAIALVLVLSLTAIAEEEYVRDMESHIKQAQQFLQKNNLAGWLLYDFRGLNPIAREFVRPQGMVTRRWFYFVPQSGRPFALVHQIEKKSFGKIFGYVETYASREELVHKLKQILPGRNIILMEYSAKGNNPYVSYVDAGMFELIRSLGAKIESSQDLVQNLLARWDQKEYQSHQEAAQILFEIKNLAFKHVADWTRKNQNLTEYDLQQFILKEFEKNGLVTDSGPDCAVNRNSANPHYSPTKENSQPIRNGDFLLIDMWGKKNTPGSMYADITWVAYVGEKVPDKYSMIFKIVAQARDFAIDYLKRNWPKSDVQGWQVDDAARQVIRKAGYADFFTHRTGHSLGKTIHSWGVNLDNFETRDERRIIPGVGFTIEPGIYLKDFGIRSEINLYAGEQGIKITTLPLQQEIIPLLKPR